MINFGRRTYLIDKPLQLRLTAYICAWIALVGLVSAVVAYAVFSHLITLATVGGGLNDPAPILALRGHGVTLLALTQTGILILAWASSILVTHRIAGPLYKLKKAFARVREGDLTQPLKFRQFDHLEAMAQDYNLMLASLRERFERGAREIELVLENPEYAEPEARAHLRAALEAWKVAEKAEAQPASSYDPVAAN